MCSSVLCLTVSLSVWDVTARDSAYRNEHFGGTCSLHVSSSAHIYGIDDEVVMSVAPRKWYIFAGYNIKSDRRNGPKKN